VLLVIIEFAVTIFRSQKTEAKTEQNAEKTQEVKSQKLGNKFL